ncbi:UDP-glucose 4-epimerase GalE, partial [Escherichia coli]|uniref:UDP-glucose 4-epimerase GalE n=4 Tax=cellular organisms TaxID=131567 RepID=UPI0010CC3B2E
VYDIDLREKEKVISVFQKSSFDAIIHFASLKSVSESVKNPLEYYDNNISGTLNLLAVMKEFNVWNFIFSSSATVYGNSLIMPVDESFNIGGVTNPYGSTKLFIENILSDLAKSDERWRIASLRYFNPVGAHRSGIIGEDPVGIPNNLIPYLMKVAMGELECLYIYGDDYDTDDGTGVRDYIHVTDLALGHISALNYIYNSNGYNVFNLGTGVPYSVMEVITTFEKITGEKVKYKITNRRPGDVAQCWSSPQLAADKLGWKATLNLEDMLRDSWNWQKNNPDGYER